MDTPPATAVESRVERLLRSRLRAVTAMILAALALWMLRAPIHPGRDFLGVQLAALVVLAALAVPLWRARALTRKRLQDIEIAILATTFVRLVVLAALLIHDRTDAGNDLLALAELYNSVFAVAALMLLYGMLVPNTWQRALAVVGPMALSPVLIVGGIALVDRKDLEVLLRLAEPEVLVNLFMAGVVSAAVAAIGAHVIHALEREAIQSRELGQYELLSKIASGGMGDIWKATHRFLARPTAIKVISAEHVDPRNPAAAAGVLHRFETEARTTAMLESLHTVKIYDFGRTERGDFYYAMELLRGIDLETMVRRHGPLPACRTINFLMQALDSLAEAHAHGQVHRDIKPSNLFACRVGLSYDVIKVLDFGLVTRTGSERAEDRRMADQEGLAGTPAYMAPEQVLADTTIDHRADIYSLGCVAYWLLTGHTVFDVDRPLAMAVAHVKAPPMPPSKRSEVPIPRDLERIVMRCLRKTPADRPATAEQLAEMLSACTDAGAWTSQLAREWWQAHHPDDPV